MIYFAIVPSIWLRPTAADRNAGRALGDQNFFFDAMFQVRCEFFIM